MLITLLLGWLAFTPAGPQPYHAVVVDATTSRPLAAVPVVNLETQQQVETDSRGHFSFPAGPVHFTVHQLGFAPLEATRATVVPGCVDTLRLLPQSVLLPEVSVRPSRKLALSSLGTKAGQRSRYLVAPGIQYGVRFQSDAGSSTAVVDEITLRLASKKPTAGRVRVRLVGLVPGTQLPSSHDLVPISATYTAHQLASVSDNLLRIDLTPYRLVLPPEGFYVLVEGLPTDPRAVHVPLPAGDKTPWLVATALDPADPATYQRTNMNAFPAFEFTSSYSTAETVVRTRAQGTWRVNPRPAKPTKSENLDITLHLSAE